ncbi:MAG TPA: hypothetical protein VH084_28425 [Mycobacterium sp.]|jgi:hypothetical protein|nr:hypothetical protein [Mycobacterium sp.]
MTLRRELHRLLTEPSRYISPKIFGVAVAVLLLSAFGLVVGIASGRTTMIVANAIVFFVYAVLTYRFWPWRKLP